jgi:hypothetical protein
MKSIKKLFGAEIKYIQKLSSCLTFRQKLNHIQIIMSAENQNKVDEAVKLLDKAASILAEIK